MSKTATFNRGDQARRVMIAKIHVAKKELGLIEDDYRAILVDQTGKLSASEMNAAELAKVIEHLKKKGFQAKPTRARTPGADHPTAKKARALWISLHQLGAVANGDERALEAFAKRQLQCERMRWADQGLMYKLIEALKAIAERNGWSQDVRGLTGQAAIHSLKIGLCEAILGKLVDAGIAPKHMPLWQAADRIAHVQADRDYVGSMHGWQLHELDTLSAALGRVLADFGPRAIGAAA